MAKDTKQHWRARIGTTRRPVMRPPVTPATVVLTEAYENGEVAPEKCEDPENFADPQTKYLTFKTWARHLHYTHNFKGDPPPRAEKKKKIAAVLAPETPWGETLD